MKISDTIYVLFWENTLLNQWLAESLTLKIKSVLFSDWSNVLKCLANNIDSEQIKEMIINIKKVWPHSHVSFISLDTALNNMEKQTMYILRDIWKVLNVNEIYHVNDFISSLEV